MLSAHCLLCYSRTTYYRYPAGIMGVVSMRVETSVKMRVRTGVSVREVYL